MPALADPFTNADLLRIPVGGGTLHVERYGFGRVPIVLLHGFGTSSFLWRAVAPELAVAGARVFAIDLMGHGESDRPLEGAFGIAHQAEHLDRALTALRVASATIVGVDLGGAVAMRLAGTRPERVEGLVLVNSLAPGACPAADLRQLPLSTARFALRISRGVLGALPLLARVLEGSVADPAHMPTGLMARYLAPYAGRDGVSHLLRLARAVDEDDLEMGPEAVAAPTLVIRGERDQWLPEGTAERLASTLATARVVSLPGAARLVPEDDPETLVRLILEHVGLREPLPAPEPVATMDGDDALGIAPTGRGPDATSDESIALDPSALAPEPARDEPATRQRWR